MIDCHVHVFPPVEEMGQRLPGSAGQWFELPEVRRGASVARQIYGNISRQLTGATLNAERLSRLRNRLKRRIFPELVDVAMNLVTAPQILLGGTVDELFASMGRAGVHSSVVIAARPLAPNDWVLHCAQQDGGGRIIPVAHLPEAETSASTEVWERGFHDLLDRGFAGFKIHPNLDGLPARHDAYRALFEAAQARDAFIILHTGCFTAAGYKHQRSANPLEFSHLLREYPAVRVCLAHMHRDHPEVAWEVMRNFPQVYADTSWQPARSIRRAVDEVGRDRLLFGSDWPLLHSGIQVEAAEALERATDRATCAQIAQDNALTFLGSAAARKA